MANPTFSVIIPTRGRPTLERTLARLDREVERDVEVIVVTDGRQPVAEAVVAKHPNVKLVEGPMTGRWGNAQRQLGIGLTRGRYLLFIDDDDVHTRHAFRHLRAAVARWPGQIVIFQMRRDGRVLWRRRELAVENVGTPMFVVPNSAGKLGSWVATGERYESDIDFIRGCVALQGEPVWVHRVIALAPPLPLLRQFRITFRRSRFKALRNKLLGLLPGRPRRAEDQVV